MFEVSREEFEGMVEDGIAAIPEKFRVQLKNLAFVVEDDPSKDQLAENGIPADDTLLGLFEGLTLGEQGSGPWEMPSVITVFKRPSEEEAVSHEELALVVRETIWHEVAHYFGMEEDEVLTAEDRRRQHGAH